MRNIKNRLLLTYLLTYLLTLTCNIAACNTRLQAYNIGVIFIFRHFSVIVSTERKLLAVPILFFVVPSHMEGHHRTVEGRIKNFSAGALRWQFVPLHF